MILHKACILNAENAANQNLASASNKNMLF